MTAAMPAKPKARPPGTSTYRRPPRGDVGGGPAAVGDRSSAERSGERRVAGEEGEGEGGGGPSEAPGRATAGGGGGVSTTCGLGVQGQEVVTRPVRPPASRPVIRKEWWV